MDLGYARVSTAKQDLDRQLHALGEVGIPTERTFVDKKSGSTTDRPWAADRQMRGPRRREVVLRSADLTQRHVAAGGVGSARPNLIGAGVGMGPSVDDLDPLRDRQVGGGQLAACINVGKPSANGAWIDGVEPPLPPRH